MLQQSLRRWLKSCLMWELEAISAELFWCQWSATWGWFDTHTEHFVLLGLCIIFLSRLHFRATFRKTIGLHYTAVLSPRYIFVLEVLQLLLRFFISQQPTCSRHFTNNYEELVSCPKRMFTAWFVWTSSSIPGNQAGISEAFVEPFIPHFFGQRKLKTDESRQQM